MRLKVEVTAEDIAKGERQSVHSCPVACALRRLWQKWATFDGFDVYDDGDANIIRAPKAARDFAIAFDAGEPVEPFTFELTDEDGP